MSRLLYYLTIAFLIYYVYRFIKRLFLTPQEPKTKCYAHRTTNGNRTSGGDIVDAEFEVLDENTDKKK